MAIDVCGVLKEGEDAALAVVGEGMEIEELAVEGLEVDFEVAGVDDDADRGLNGEGDAIDEGVGDVDGLDGERADGEFFFGDDFNEFCLVEEAVLFEVALDVSQGELSGVDGDLDFVQDPGQSANARDGLSAAWLIS